MSTPPKKTRYLLTPEEAALIQEIRLLQTAYGEEQVKALTVVGSNEFAAFAENLMNMAVKSNEQAHPGVMFGFALKLHLHPAQRKHQYYLMRALIEAALGPRDASDDEEDGPFFPQIDDRLLLN